MKKVVEGQCGQQNALVGLANTFGQSNQRIAPSANPTSSFMPNSTFAEQMANEYLKQQNNTIAPTSFNMESIRQNLPTSSASSSLAHKWGNEYQPQQNQLATQWARQYNAPPTMTYESAWQQSTNGMTSVNQPMTSTQYPMDTQMWSSEYLDNVESKLSNTTNMSQSWADEFTGGLKVENSGGMSDIPPAQMADYEQRWEQIKREMEEESATKQDENYPYQSVNPYSTIENPLAQGDIFMRQGDIGNAMLAYEAAVQRDPQNAEAWCRLGLSHAENEKDQLAIQSFTKSIEIDPVNKEALLGLSVSLANEGMENGSLHQLDKWLSVYMGSDATQVITSSTHSSFLDRDAFDRVESRFLNAAQKQGMTPDPQLQNALGILYNLSRNFDRAIDSLKLAISGDPTDARLWNRLGATLANGDRTTEAVSAYREALNRYPTYVRARYNLGISCMQLRAYKDAIQHFVSALDIQKGGNDSSGIWRTLRSAIIRVEASPELQRAIENRDMAAVKAALPSLL